MNKNEFISELDNSLKGMSIDDKREIIYDYEEYFRAGKEHGKSEEEIAQALGDPKVIARQFIVKNNYAKTSNAASIALKSIGVGFINIVLILPLLLSALCVVFSLAVSAAAIAVSLVVVYISLLISFYACAAGLTLGGVGIVLAIFLRPVLPDFITIDLNYGSAILLAVAVFCLGILSFIGAVKVSGVSAISCKGFLIATYNVTKRITLSFYNWVLKYIKMNISIVLNKKENEDA